MLISKALKCMLPVLILGQTPGVMATPRTTNYETIPRVQYEGYSLAYQGQYLVGSFMNHGEVVLEKFKANVADCERQSLVPLLVCRVRNTVAQLIASRGTFEKSDDVLLRTRIAPLAVGHNDISAILLSAVFSRHPRALQFFGVVEVGGLRFALLSLVGPSLVSRHSIAFASLFDDPSILFAVLVIGLLRRSRSLVSRIWMSPEMGDQLDIYDSLKKRGRLRALSRLVTGLTSILLYQLGEIAVPTSFRKRVMDAVGR